MRFVEVGDQRIGGEFRPGKGALYKTLRTINALLFDEAVLRQLDEIRIAARVLKVVDHGDRVRVGVLHADDEVVVAELLVLAEHNTRPGASQRDQLKVYCGAVKLPAQHKVARLRIRVARVQRDVAAFARAAHSGRRLEPRRHVSLYTN